MAFSETMAAHHWSHLLEIRMAKKTSSDKTASLAGRVLAGKKATAKEAKTLAASVLSQDETKGRKKH